MEKIARIFVILLVLAAGALPFAWPALAGDRPQPITLRARMPENGGWGLDTLAARVGEPLRLRLTSDDVMHSFQLAQTDRSPVNIVPGEWQDVELVFDRPGKYTFYCNRWCGPEHWRMRGTIEVSGNAPQSVPTRVAQPLYLALEIDVDAPHPAASIPAGQPDAQRGAELENLLPEEIKTESAYRSNSPAEMFQRLRAEAALAQYGDSDVWDAVVWLWQKQALPAQLAQGAQLYAQECAACHGDTGRGDGVMLRDLPEFSSHEVMSGHGRTRPPDLSDPRVTLGASPALLEGKLLRGGMGTGMPMFGNIFTQAQLDALVKYLYTLVQYPQSMDRTEP